MSLQALGGDAIEQDIARQVPVDGSDLLMREDAQVLDRQLLLPHRVIEAVLLASHLLGEGGDLGLGLPETTLQKTQLLVFVQKVLTRLPVLCKRRLGPFDINIRKLEAELWEAADALRQGSTWGSPSQT